MQPNAYLSMASEMLNARLSREEPVEVLDELEYLYEAVDPEFQELASHLMEQYSNRLNEL